ncbi:MAG TPA: YihY/virulence factor BrkB family protein [Gaiellaceae bacterium]|nr:YihY/virulence factor BrkB family protein [Gaiellaceae bacterium]
MSTATERAQVGRAPSGPERLSVAEWAAVFKRAFKEFLADDCMGLAQQVAYSSLLAFFPAVVFLIGLFDLLGAYDALQEFLDPVAPQAVTNLVEQLQKDSSHRGSVVAVALGAFGAVWAASGAMSAIVRAVNRAYGRIETRPFWKVRLIAIVLVGASGLVTAGMLLMIVFGGKLGEAIAEQAGLGSAFTWLWNLLRWPLAFVIVLLLFAVIYYVAPDTEQRSWRWVTPGSLVGALMWLALSGLFALFTAFSDSYSATYGTLAGGIILLLWLTYSAWAILFGAELNAELDRQADIRAAGGPERRARQAGAARGLES